MSIEPGTAGSYETFGSATWAKSFSSGNVLVVSVVTTVMIMIDLPFNTYKIFPLVKAASPSPLTV